MRFRWNDKPKTPKPPRPASAAAAPPSIDSVAEYKNFVAKGSALADTRAAEVIDPLSNPDTIDHLRYRARQTSLAEIDARHEERLHGLDIDRRRRRIDTEAAESELDYRLDQRDEAKARVLRIRAARAATDPATAAADMARLDRTRSRRYLVISWVMSALAAVGIAASVYAAGWSLGMAIGAGLAAETGLSFLVGSIISDQAEIQRRTGLARDHEGTRIARQAPAWTRMLPWLAVGGLLTMSVVINGYGLISGKSGEIGLLGAVGAIVAALTALLSWGYSVQASTTVTDLLSDSGIQAGEDALDEIASGAHLPRTTSAGPDRDEVLAAIAADPRLLDAVLADAAERVTAEVPQPPAIPAPRPPADTTEVEVDTGDRGGVALAEREGLAEGARASAAEAIANRNRILAARLELIAEGTAEPSVSAIAARAGVSRRTVNRHLGG